MDSSSNSVKKALFLDRDGVINIDHGYVYEIEKFHFVDGIVDLVSRAVNEGYIPIVITNQSGIGRGYYSEDDFERVTSFMLERFAERGVHMDRDAIFHCPHAPEDECDCRKPRPGMILEASSRFDIDLPSSIMIGDKTSDMEAAERAGVGRKILVEKDKKIEWERLFDGFQR